VENERERELKALADRLARFYRRPGREIGPCACLGLACGESGCAQWWTFFLQYFTADDVVDMARARIS
jgi:hypothetical protein